VLLKARGERARDEPCGRRCATPSSIGRSSRRVARVTSWRRISTGTRRRC